MYQRKSFVILVVIMLAYGCSAPQKKEATATDAVLKIVALPFKIVGAMVFAAIGAASGMGMMEGEIIK
jgi:Ca2+/H+ antiporter